MQRTKLLSLLIILTFTVSGCARIRTSLLPSPSTTRSAVDSTSLESLLDSSSDNANGNAPGMEQSVLADGESQKGGLPAARKVEFTTEARAFEYATVGPTIYFFTSQNCASCVTASKDFNDNISDLPAGMTIVMVNFDTTSALISKYNVTSAHTFVMIDQSGTALSTWQGGGVNEILARF